MTPENVRIKPLETEEERESLRKIYAEAFPDKDPAETVRFLTGTDFAHTVLAVVDGEVVAFGSYVTAADYASVLDIATRKEFRGRGIGRVTVGAMIDEWKASGIRDVDLEVRVSNTVAIRLYESFGFTATHVFPKYYRQPTEDGILMTLSLGEKT